MILDSCHEALCGDKSVVISTSVLLKLQRFSSIYPPFCSLTFMQMKIRVNSELVQSIVGSQQELLTFLTSYA